MEEVVLCHPGDEAYFADTQLKLEPSVIGRLISEGKGLYRMLLVDKDIKRKKLLLNSSNANYDYVFFYTSESPVRCLSDK